MHSSLKLRSNLITGTHGGFALFMAVRDLAALRAVVRLAAFCDGEAE